MKTNQNTTSKFKYSPMLLILVITFLFSSCDKKDDNMVPEMQQPADISVALQQITDNPDSFNGEISDLKKQSLKEKKPKFKSLIQALVKTKLVSTVAKNELTVFAPTDEAFQNLFDALGVSGIYDLTAEQLTPILLYHVIGGKIMSNDLSDGFFETENGAKIQVDLSNGVMVNDANVTIADIHAANGVIHIIDKVLLPPSMNLVEKAISFNPEFSILVDAVVKAGLDETLANGGPFTVFAPTNAAFEALFSQLGVNGVDDLTAEQLTPILLYHVLNGKVFSTDLMNQTATTLNGSTIVVNTDNGVMINDSKVIQANVQTTNGIIHVVDKVLLPPSMNLVEKAISFNPEFSILVDAVVKAGLDGTLANDGPFTVFAPTNAAFETLFSQLGVSSINDLTAEQLTPILLYHVVEGSVFSTDLANGIVPTLNGSDIQIDLSSGVMINDASVVQANVQATNGVIHVIDKVLIP